MRRRRLDVEGEPNPIYSAALNSLGGLRISSTGKPPPSSPPSQAARSKLGLGKSESLPVLPSYFDAPKATFVARTPPARRIGAAARDVQLPPLTLSLKAARGNIALDSPPKADEEHEEDEEEGLSDDEQVAALHGFNYRHARRTRNARGLLSVLEKTERQRHSDALGLSYDDAIGEVFRNRFWVKEAYDPFDAGKPQVKKRRRKKWKLEESTIWYARVLHGNARDFYETDEALRSIFNTDWKFASAPIRRMVERSNKRADVDGSGVQDAVDAAGEMLWKHYRVILGAFDYYAALIENGKDADGEIDIFNMTYNAFSEFARDCGLICDACPLATIDIIWTTVNVLPIDALQRQLDRWNHKRVMCRHEFMQALMRIAIAHYEGGLAPAVDLLCSRLRTVLPAEALQDSNVFRKKRCYSEMTDMTLRRKQPSLKAIFDVYARANRNRIDELQDSKLVSIGEWLLLLEHTGLLESGQVSFFGAKLIFKWSMIRACEDHSAKSERKMRHLTFSDFCEALVRVACVMALPTDEEVEESHAHDAAEYLFAMQDAKDGTLENFISARKTGWQRNPRQHVSRCVHHLIGLLHRTVKEDVHVTEADIEDDMTNAPICEQEVIKFEERRRMGRTLQHVQSAAGLLDGIRASASIVRTRQLEALRRVEIFRQLTDEQLDVLCDSLSQAPFSEGQYVFEQGDEGDSFYIITEGSASVLRAEPGSEEEKQLGVLGEGAFFGERALIKNQVRYAGICSQTPQLHTVFITRGDFERALGRPLEQLVPDQYHLDAAELLQRLAGVKLFANLTEAQIKQVADRCTEVKFPHGTDVVRQGDAGDALFVITRGTADVLRWPEPEIAAEGEKAEKAEEVESGENVEDVKKEPPPPVEPELLTTLGTWTAFGERALIKNDTRYASVRVTSDDLHAMSISRDVFEAALGLRLADVLPPPPSGVATKAPNLRARRGSMKIVPRSSKEPRPSRDSQ